ncbi:hypothetical protein SAMN04488066_12221 [Halorubrum aquaticum]|uniref:Uncharacterized protein n=1 Tax=Halorubrum aquaticum TaxID=387340 RepID=A0A1I3CFL4_9EURY|nr:hypothetical protein [Halorubrum aquaticum]SFH73340.1 hypothetical protein SAMN04488066_12221 [Halorubrum aquaticum]
MTDLEDHRVLPHVIGESPGRSRLPLLVIVLLLLASGGFVIGTDIGLSLGWIVLALGIATVAGFIGAGLIPTIGSLWLIGFWWFVFPPIVGYLSGNWAGATRYNHPRMMGYGYTSAHAEVIGGIEYGVQFGLLLAIILGLIGYPTGIAVDRLVSRVKAVR